MGFRDPIHLNAYAKPPGFYVRFEGSLTVQNFESTLKAFNDLFKQSPEELYVMLADIQYLDSAGLGLFVRLNTRCRAAGSRLTLLNPSPEVARLLTMSRLDLVLSILRGPAAREVTEAYEIDSQAIDLIPPPV